MRILPETGLGKIALWTGVASFALMHLQYWVAILFRISIPPLAGIPFLLLVLFSGIAAVVSIAKYKDKAILLAIPILIGLFGVFLLLGEIFFEH